MENEEISFGRFRLDLGRRELLRDEAPVRLHRRALDILCALAAAKGAIVGKDELLALLWPGRIVEEGNLHVHVSALRKALGEDGEGHSYIVTVPGRGYRLAGFTGAAPADSAAALSPRPLPLPDKPSIVVLPFDNLNGTRPVRVYALHPDGVATPTEEPGPAEPTVAAASTVRPEHVLLEPAAPEIAGDNATHVALPAKLPATLRRLRGAWHSVLSRRWLLWGGLGTIAGALCLAVLGGVWAGRSDNRLLSEDGPSIVVMPLRAIDENRQVKLGESIADGLSTQLSQLPGAQIVSSETARTYLLKSLDARQARRELGVAYVVEGSVTSAQPGVHAEATLIKTLHDTVASPIWADVAETEAGSARDNIVTGLIWALVSAIIREEGSRADQKPAATRTANDLVWLGWSTFNRNLPNENSVEGLGFLENALRIDKKNVDALALKANFLIGQVQNNPKTGDYQSKLSAADALLTEALIIQPWHVLARYGRCLLLRAQSRYEEALGFCRTLVNDLYRRPLAYKEIGFDYVYLGRPDLAVSAFNTADHLVKRASGRWTWLLGGGWANLQVGNYEEAIKWLRRALAERPRTYSARVWLIAAYALSERQQDAATELAELQRAHPELFSSVDALAQMISPPGAPAFGEHMRNVIEGLKKGGFPERMINPVLAKSLVPVGSQNSAGGSASR
jgi:DNA-binding winged helix-turn-helix (wHTH) protein/tetratricopeptide (TPR) repeat protein